MYNQKQDTMDSKEKLDNFRKLRNSADALKDIALLKSKNPTLDRLNRYERNPSRYADEILYDLLDCCSADKIVSNRKDDKKETDKPKSGNKNGSKSKGNNKNGSKSKDSRNSKQKISSKPKAADKPKEAKPDEITTGKGEEKVEADANETPSSAVPVNNTTEDPKKK